MIKLIKSFLVVAGLAFFSFGVNAKTIQVQYDGVKCSSCVKKFTKAFNKYDKKNGGDIVTNVNVDWKNMQFTIETNGEKDISDVEITEILKNKGYTIKSVSRS